VLPIPDEKTYYLFGSTDPNIWTGPGVGFDCYQSVDLAQWLGPVAAFRPPPGFWAPGSFWAPEVHRFADQWFMLATFTGQDGERGTQVLRAPRPEGPYEPWSEGPVTPREWQCLDGTLYQDESGPWLVFCHEWLQCGDGEICAVRLTDDLRNSRGDVALLFRASDAPWTSEVNVTDGPFLFRTSHGELLMLWSSLGERGYALGVAKSVSGSLIGPWRQDANPLWDGDGGHGMIFRSFDGELHLTLHTPNDTPNERAIIIPLAESELGVSIR
jgi:hypothetical protein